MKRLIIHIVLVLFAGQAFCQTDTIWVEEEPDKQFYADVILTQARNCIVDNIKDCLVKIDLNFNQEANFHIYKGCDSYLSESGGYTEEYYDCYASYLFRTYIKLDSAYVLRNLNDSLRNNLNLQDIVVPFFFNLTELSYRKYYEIHKRRNSAWECPGIAIPEYVLKNDTCNFLNKSDLVKIVSLLGYDINKIPGDYEKVGINKKLIDDAFLDFDAELKQWFWYFYIENNDSHNSLCEKKVPAIIITGGCDNIIIRQIFTD